ncbi:MAG: hypothetical protein QOH93_76 [Chloroflexia bacterium]|jgi:hypothetical protein|nr:hypothetical protein [Chloroflexia bacterium]
MSSFMLPVWKRSCSTGVLPYSHARPAVLLIDDTALPAVLQTGRVLYVYDRIVSLK